MLRVEKKFIPLMEVEGFSKQEAEMLSITRAENRWDFRRKAERIIGKVLQEKG